VKGMKGNFSWIKKGEKPSAEEKETAYGSWADFECKTGMTKNQYFKREKQLENDLSKKEVTDCIY